MWKQGLILVGAGALGAAATVAVQRSDEGPERVVHATPAGDESALAALEARLHATERSLERLAVAPPRQGEAEEANPEPAVDRGPERDERVAPVQLSAEEEAERNAGLSEDLSEALAEETVDVKWARETVRSAQEAADAAGLGVEALRCGSTFCEMSFTADDKRAAMEELVWQAPFNHGGWVHLPNGEDEAELFFVREGEELPVSPAS